MGESLGIQVVSLFLISECDTRYFANKINSFVHR